MKKSILLLCVCWLALSSAIAQGIIYLENPSLEGPPKHSKYPPGWANEGFEGDTPGDTHPAGAFGVAAPAAHGQTYVGMVVRDIETWECMGQRLRDILQADTCYRVVFRAARSPVYESVSRLTHQKANYDKPVIVRLWAGNKGGDGLELLGQTEPVEHEDWQLYELTFQPTANYDYLYVEAYYSLAENRGRPYNGNVLVDDFSPIVPCSLAGPGADMYEFAISRY